MTKPSTPLPAKRHSAWYERLFFSTTTQFILTTLICAVLPAFILWGQRFFTSPLETQSNSFWGVVGCNLAILLTLRTLMKFPGNRSSSFIISTILGYYTLLFLAFFTFRVNHSIVFLFFSLSLSLLYGFTGYFFGKRWSKPKIALIPFGRATGLDKIPFASWYVMTEPRLDTDRRFNMIVTDLHANELTAPWQKFIADSVVAGMPVFNARQVQESLTGRVLIHHMYENQLGSLLPSPVYSLIKRLGDLSFVLFTLPITLPIMALTALAIFIESPGNPFFTQKRVGKGGKEFTIIKFRSMTKDSEKSGAQFATPNDHRITKVGAVIRKTRLDELPQFFNVLKGDMSLIGPRPEQKEFVDEFEKKIPFYNYRHILRPGVSGWAQVMHGYAADVADNQVKVEYDFYYIKHFSLWLDILIVFKTIRIIVTGFGAR